jgi:hypothetical protein
MRLKRVSGAVLALACAACLHDPSPGLFRTKDESRNLECVRLSHSQAHELYPGVVPAEPPRGAYWVTDALVCGSRIVKLGERAARDEAVLTTLRQSVGDLTRQATANAPADTLWHVDAFYPSPEVSQKIAVAARVDLAERGFNVSDRVPVLSAGDISVLSTTGGDKAFALACRRYFAEAVLHSGEGFLGFAMLDRHETSLHAGYCLDGKWRWIQ